MLVVRGLSGSAFSVGGWVKATQRHNDEAMELLRVEAQMLKGSFLR